MILDRYLLRQFFPVFLVALSMFVLLLSLIELFKDLWRYLNYEVPIHQMLRVCYYYLPKAVSYATPISLLFASAYTLGDLYARNELTSIFSAGIPFWRFSLPLVLVGLAVSVCAFFFEDRLVIPTFKIKTDLSRELLHQQRKVNNSDIVIKAQSGQLIYSVDFYDDKSQTITGVNIVEQDEDGNFTALIRATKGVWTGAYWELVNPLIYRWEGDLLRVSPLPPSEDYREEPDVFRRNNVEVESLPARDAVMLARDLRQAGLPFIGALADYYHRYSWAAVSFVVIVLSISMGGRFKKNILLMSLLTSLMSSVVYYVMEMVCMMMARLGYIPPLAGAWSSVVVFTVLGLLLLRTAKT